MEQKKKKVKNQLFQKRSLIEKVDNKIVKLFKNHIGKENMIFIDEVFFDIFGEDMEETPFKKYFWKDFILKRIRVLRRTGRCFITCQQRAYFVLKTQGEADFYKDILRREIRAIKGSLHKADEWVKEEKWRFIE